MIIYLLLQLLMLNKLKFKKIFDMKTKKQKKMTIGLEEYIRANKGINRKEELERNGGRWIAINRPHKNKKKYNRKRDRKMFISDGLFNFYRVCVRLGISTYTSTIKSSFDFSIA